jgi:hypothetical protein
MRNKMRFLISVLPLVACLAAAGCGDEGSDGPKLAAANVDASGVDGSNLNNDGGSDSTSPDTVVDLNQCVGQPDGAACDDSNVCTDNDSCKSGTCVGNTKVCDDKNLCTTDTCEPKTGCVFKDNAIACNDSDACTVGEICSGGKCQPGIAIKCDDGNKCTGDTCDPTKGCVFLPLTGMACSDGNACTTNDTCASDGTCKSGPATECDDGDPCTGDSCDKSAGGCQHVGLSGQACNDGIDGTIGDKCLNGKCLGNNVACDDGTACTVDGFNAKTGKCENLGVVCDDKNLCTDDKCDPTKGCTFTNNTAACDDGDVCTSGDTCKAGTCVSGPGPSCDDQNACTVDKCDPTKGCTHLGLTGPVCDDGNACLVGEMCNGGVCAGGIAPVCNDNSACTKDTCDPAKGCVSIPLTGVACNDGNACTIGDQCSVSGVCLAGNVTLDCNDGNPCTTDSCDKAVVTGCVHAPLNGVACDDNNQYTASDVCSAGVCKGIQIACDDGNKCTLDSGSLPKNCTFTDIVCDDGNSCTNNTCDPKTGACVSLPNVVTTACDDMNLCTTGDVCAFGTCASGPVLACNDNDPCTVDACVPAVGACSYNKIPGCGTGEICGNGIDDDGDMKIDCSDSECGPKMKNGKLAYEVAYVLYAYSSWGGKIKFVTADQPGKVQEYSLPADSPSPNAMSYTFYCNEVPFTATLSSNGGMLKGWTQGFKGISIDEKIASTPKFWELGFWSSIPAKGPPAKGNGFSDPDGNPFVLTWPVQ